MEAGGKEGRRKGGKERGERRYSEFTVQVVGENKCRFKDV